MLEGQECFRETNAEKTTALLEHVRLRAEQKGMAVNEKKTGLMCVSASRSYKAKVSIEFNGQRVRGESTLKMLGVTLDQDCTFKTHVGNIARRLRQRTWALSKLRRKGMQQEDLIQAYVSVIRPVAEYASPAWHPLLTIEQSEKIERQQTQALKNIFGLGMSANKMRTKAGLDRLWVRREGAVKNFAQKNQNNKRCAEWFAMRPVSYTHLTLPTTPYV